MRISLNEFSLIYVEGCWRTTAVDECVSVLCHKGGSCGSSFGFLSASGVCIRLVDRANQPVARLKLPSTLDCQNPQIWQQLRDTEGHYYHRLIYPLHTRAQTDWGKLQIVQSLNNFDLYMLWVEVALVAVIGMAILAAGVASWQLAKLAMQPIQYSYPSWIHCSSVDL